jgi:hypothetical protein
MQIAISITILTVLFVIAISLTQATKEIEQEKY